MTETYIPPLPAPWLNIASRLASEGVPVRVIARSMERTAEDVRETLEYAKELGTISEIPRDDWPPTARRADRIPSTLNEHSDGDLLFACMRGLKLTRLQASFMMVLLKRNEVDKDTLHHVVESQRAIRQSRPDNMEETDPKMVDVVICNMRKRLKPLGISITTVWGHGYFLNDISRKVVENAIALTVTTLI